MDQLLRQLFLCCRLWRRPNCMAGVPEHQRPFAFELWFLFDENGQSYFIPANPTKFRASPTGTHRERFAAHDSPKHLDVSQLIGRGHFERSESHRVLLHDSYRGTATDEATPDGNNSLYRFNFLTQRDLKVAVRRQRGGVDAACVTSALAGTSGLRPSQSAQLSEAIIFLRFRSRNACAGRRCLLPAAHTGQPCEDTMQPATSEHTAQSARRRLCNIEHIGDGSIGGHGKKAARQREGKRRVANRHDWAIRKCEQFGTEGLSKGPDGRAQN
jgi:hypothetical protein